MYGNIWIGILILFPMAGAIISYLLGRKNKLLRDIFADMIVIAEMVLMVCLWVAFGSGSLKADWLTIPDICGMGLSFTLDGFRVIYGSVASLMWMMATLFSKEYFNHHHNRNRYYLFLLLTLGATMGVFLSADLFTTFIFFEMMSFTSYVWVAQEEKKDALRAAGTYLAIAVIGGLVMLMGLFLLYHELGTLQMSDLKSYGMAGNPHSLMEYIAGGCLLFGFAAKAGAFPLHIWLPKAHPVAPAPASALLSGILTKAGMFGILIVSCSFFYQDTNWGTLILLIGVATMVVGAVLALFSIDLKRTLACSSVSQIGFILIGVGMHGLLGADNTAAAHGAFLHMVNHSLFKLVLFMAAGVVFMNLHQLNLNEIRGFGRKKPMLNFIFLMGSLGIGCIPLWSGYVSKTLLHESIVEYTNLLGKQEIVPSLLSIFDMKIIERIFLLSGGMTVAYMLKLYVVLFVEKNRNAKVQEQFDAQKGHYMKPVSAVALLIPALLFPILGIGASSLMNRIADMANSFLCTSSPREAVAYYSIENLKGSLISIGIGVILYFVVVRLCLMRKTQNGTEYVNCWPRFMDLEDYFYRPVLLVIFPAILGFCSRIFDAFIDTIVVCLRKTLYRDSKLPYELDEGNALTHTAGILANCLQHLLNIILHRSEKKNVDYEHLFALKYSKIRENSTLISRSMSFGLGLFCGGLILTLVYLILW